MYDTPYFLNLRAMWADFPTRAITPTVKWYYLVQFAFWLQQLFVVNVEERRKDHWQMFTHHVFTSALLLWSYGFYQDQSGKRHLVYYGRGRHLASGQEFRDENRTLAR